MRQSLFLGFFLFLVFYLPLSSKTYAAEFTVDYSAEYIFSPTGKASITNQITLTNQQSGSYASEYVFQVKDLNLKNLEAQSNSKKLPLTVEEKDKIKIIKISLNNNKTTLRDQKYTFNLSYQTIDLAKKRGLLWQIDLPSPPALLNSYQLKIAIPVEFGEPKLLSLTPKSLEQKDNQRLLSYLFNQPKTSISPRLIFGGLGLFSFELTYHLFNPKWKSEIQTIAILPNIPGYQEIFIASLNPKPLTIETDPDGNVLASYKVDYNEKKDIKLIGLAKILTDMKTGSNQQSTINNKQSYLLPAKYWETNDEAILNLLSNLTNDPKWLKFSSLEKTKVIYDFVVNFLSYDQQKTNPRLERFGAVKALANKDKALCMEYTDLLITLLRASDIPARELDGYAAGGVSPSLTGSSDILHTWVQIFDKDRGWFMVDPTWEGTTNQDYFNFWDFNHLAFVVKGLDSEKPLPAGLYKITGQEKGDVKVEFAQKMDEKATSLDQWIENLQKEKERGQIASRFIELSLAFLVLAAASGLAVFIVSRKKYHA